MNSKYLFFITLIISIIIQIITGIIELTAFFIKVPTTYSILKQLLAIELIVQFFEGSFYFWLANNFNKVFNITPKRYIDWAITTPSMLIILMIYLIYLNKRTLNLNNQLNFFTIFKDNYFIFIPVLLLNWSMLIFGYLGEINFIPTLLSTLIGFIPFFIYYYIIYINYVSTNTNTYSKLIFWYFLFFWSLYGFVTILPYYIKNSLYNIFDLFSKNFFGLFLSYIIFYNIY